MARRTSSKFTVEAIETVPMTPQQYEDAVKAFATLIAHWLQNGGADQHVPSDDADQAPRGGSPAPGVADTGT
jgi:hypothetical protein